MQAECENTLSEARAEVKLKAYQFEQLSIAMEHAKSSQRQTTLENEMLQKKVQVLRDELDKEKTAAARRIAILEVQLGVCAQSDPFCELISGSALAVNVVYRLTEIVGAQQQRVQSLEDLQLESDTVASISNDSGKETAGYPQPSASVRLAAAKSGNARKVRNASIPRIWWCGPLS